MNRKELARNLAQSLTLGTWSKQFVHSTLTRRLPRPLHRLGDGISSDLIVNLPCIYSPNAKIIANTLRRSDQFERVFRYCNRRNIWPDPDLTSPVMSPVTGFPSLPFNRVVRMQINIFQKIQMQMFQLGLQQDLTCKMQPLAISRTMVCKELVMTEKSSDETGFDKAGCGLPDVYPAIGPISKVTCLALNVPRVFVSVSVGEDDDFQSSIGMSKGDVKACRELIVPEVRRAGILQVGDLKSAKRVKLQKTASGLKSVRAVLAVPVVDEQGETRGTIAALDTKPRRFTVSDRAALRDIATNISGMTALHRAAVLHQAAEAELKDAMEALPDGFVLYDKNDRLVHCNRRYREIYKESGDLRVPGVKFSDLIRQGVYAGQYSDAIGNEEEWIAQRIHEHQNPGKPIEQQLPGDRWLRIQERRTNTGGLVGFRIDVTELKRQERELSRLAWTDSLTGALNRHRFLELAEAELSHSQRHFRNVSLLMLDLDNFKTINDCHGHAAGDHVLRSTCKSWQSQLRGRDLIGRLGGEEFCVLLPETRGSDALVVAERLRKATEQQKLSFDDEAIAVSVSIGAAVYENIADTITSVIKRADQSLYKAKSSGRNRVEASVSGS
jgi:diguanylate cyclase (GGDEF)-like protein